MKYSHILPVFLLSLAVWSCRTVEPDVVNNREDLPSGEVLTTPEEKVEIIDDVVLSEVSEADAADYESATVEPNPPSRSAYDGAYEGDKMIKSSVSTTASRREAGDPVSKLPESRIEPGQITAGEWNDLNNWEDWKSLLKDQDYTDMQSYWHIFPRSRYTVFITNEYEIPIPNALVELHNKSGDVVWKSRTDNAGKAELWLGLFDETVRFESCDLTVRYGDLVVEVEDAKSISEGVNRLVLDVECSVPPEVDVVLVVDATGSMGDEIRFLQSEFRDVISRVEKGQKSLRLRTGAVFYRDENDVYLTRTQGLGEDHTGTLDFISEQTAQGGGDYPEAVDAALSEALAQDWSEEAVAKIIFLVLDAPPHKKEYEMDRIRQQVKDAAAEGIKIIPITASGINRPTEFLMKFMAIATNGTYVFITDHSGIGSSHLDPLVKDYEVEKLNDLMVRLVRHYTKVYGCNANEEDLGHISVYPNPASNTVYINSSVDLERLDLLSSSGKRVLSVADPVLGANKVDVNHLIDGVYTVQCIGKDQSYTQPLIVVSR